MIAKIRVLIIDDDEDDYLITSHYLEDITDFQVEHSWCYRSDEALALLKKNEYDAYFIDYRLGIQTGLEIMHEAINDGCDKPIILLTGKGNNHIDKMAVEYGAYDYLIKSDLSAEKLERTLRYAIERYRSFKIIKDNEKKYKLLFENATSSIFISDNLLHFVEGNRVALSLFKCSAQELVGKSLFNYIKDPKDPLLKKMISNKITIDNYLIEVVTATNEKIIGNLSLHYFELDNDKRYWQGIILNETNKPLIGKTGLQV